MADIAFAVMEVEKHRHNQQVGQPMQQQQQQQQQQLRGLSSSAAMGESYHVPQQLQQGKGYLLVDHSLVPITPKQSHGAGTTTNQNSQQTITQQQLPEQQLSLQELNPFPESVFSYTLFLACSLAVWVLYLLLPRGVRKQYFKANRKRYAKRLDNRMPAAGYWMPVKSVKAQSAVGSSSENASTVSSMMNQQQNAQVPHYSATIAAAAARHHQRQAPPSMVTPVARQSSSSSSPSSPPRSSREASLKHPPSPEHPALKKIPPNKIIAETMARLQGRGIRLVAHGVHCDPKRVWIRLQEEEGKPGGGEPSVTWQTEFPRRVPDQSGHVSIVLMRGSLHSITLKNILYIDVGKKTHALQLTRGVPDTMCLSLLTQNGSLDLQANSKLERDSLVSCFSMILDDIHEEDWRALYEASPEPSLANSSTVVGGYNGNIYHHPYSRTNNNDYDSSLTLTATPASNHQFQTPGTLEPNTTSKMSARKEKNRMLESL